MKQNFTLNLGLRYEYWGTPENVLQFPSLDSRFGQGLAGGYVPIRVCRASNRPTKTILLPASASHTLPISGIASWAATRPLSAPAMESSTTESSQTSSTTRPVALQTAWRSALSGTRDRIWGGASLTPPAFSSSLQPTQSATSAVSTISSHLLNPLTHQWNLDIQRELPGGFNVTAAYVGTRGEHLFVNQEFNPFGENPDFGSVTVRTNGGDSIYHSGQLLVERPFKHGLLLRGAYTYSKFIDDQSEVFVTSGGSSRSEDLFNQHSDRGPSAFDRRHRFTLAYLYELPYVHNRSNAFMMVLNAITSGWQSSGTITFSTGAPETVIDNFDVNGDGFNNDRPDLGNPKAPFNSVGIDGSQLGGPTGVIFPFDPCVFGTGGACAPARCQHFPLHSFRPAETAISAGIRSPRRASSSGISPRKRPSS